jgi:hypothetical protein
LGQSELPPSKTLRRLYPEEKLQVRRQGGRKRALGTRRPMLGFTLDGRPGLVPAGSATSSQRSGASRLHAPQWD